jgi:hypothetical protein
MRPVWITQTGVGDTKPVPFNLYAAPTNIALGGTLMSGAATYTVQYTFDDVRAAGYNPATGNWVDHAYMTAKAASADSNIAYPVTAVRLRVTAGTGVVRLAVIQAGGAGQS